MEETSKNEIDELSSSVNPSSINTKALKIGKELSRVRQQMSPRLKFKIKLFFSLIMFAGLFLFGKVDLGKAWQAALGANLWFLSTTAIVFVSSMILNAVRWQILVTALGFKKSLPELIKYCYAGLFFNLFLPSTVGGDFSRCYYLSKGTNKYADAFYSVLADRASGIAVLFITATLGIVLSPAAAALPWQLKWPIFAGTFGTLVILPTMPFLTKKILGENNWLSRQLNNSSASIFWQNKSLMFSALMWSFVAQFIMVLCHLGVGMALGLTQIPLWYYFIFYPAVAVLGFITPSFNGIGIREWAYTYFLMLVGVDRAHALTYALMWLGLTTFASLFGGLVYLLSHMKPPPPEGSEFN